MALDTRVKNLYSRNFNAFVSYQRDRFNLVCRVQLK